MDKQRLMELAGINEVQYAGAASQVWVIVEYMDADFEVTGPFMSKRAADQFRSALIGEHELEPETLTVVAVSSPDESMGS
ncbi:hypothetical protein LCGC14_1482630 [marine sediment metagenome]|uniref:Uncharacterized protein n=1 Tax=marine sediment metagenome TaxID=412755 RepID=A0A0F9J961_9ZZZZ